MADGWSTIDIAGKPVDVYDPPGPERPRFGVLHLHGVGLRMLTDQPAFTSVFAELNLACLAPHSQRSWWVDRICPEFDMRLTPERHLLDNVLPNFARRWGVRPPAVGVEGISMGGQGALRLAFKHPDLFPVAAGISSAIDFHELYGQGSPLDEMYDSKEQCRQDTAPMHIHPTTYPPHLFFCIDPADANWIRGNERLHEKLSALGVPHEIDFTTRAGGHTWDYFTHVASRVVRFVHAGLVEMSRRLL
jgi:S-formylglutathione hydrolase